jgi:hypothetical protein
VDNGQFSRFEGPFDWDPSILISSIMKVHHHYDQLLQLVEQDTVRNTP